jgi:hypothetical protein
MLHVVQLRELAAVGGSCEALELLQRLPAEVRPVHQEQHPAGAGELDQPIGDVRRRERLPRTDCTDQPASASIRSISTCALASGIR